MKLVLTILGLCLLLLNANNLQAQELSTKSGIFSVRYYQDSLKIEKDQFITLLNSNKDASVLWKESKKFESLFLVALPVVTGLGIWNYITLQNDNPNIILGSASLGVAIVGLILIFKSESKAEQAVKIYNEQLTKKTTLRLMPSTNGIGLVLSF